MSITTFPVFIEGEPYTIAEVHDGDRLGDITLSGIEGQFPIHASAVHRRLYSIRVIHPTAGPLGLISGSYGQPLVLTWSECEERITEFEKHVGTVTAPGTTFKIERAA